MELPTDLCPSLGIPRATVEKLYTEFVATTGKDNRMDKKEFRRLYKELYTSGRTGTSVPAVISEHDLEKISDRVFKAFDNDNSGKITLASDENVNHRHLSPFRQTELRR
jgi:Ca2+-binding EF-hand superfamily protein